MMKVVKIILGTMLSIVVLILIVGLVTPKEFHAGSEITINKPIKEVFDFVRVLRNQSQYDPWSKQDPKIQQNYSGFDGKVGSSYVWKSKKVGDGKQVITQITPNERIDIDIFFYDDDKANKTYFLFEKISEKETKVTWNIGGEMPYPWNVMGLFYDMNKDFKEGVEGLKFVLEKQ